GREPIVAGKPSATIMEQAVARAGATRALAVGDRLDTDIAGAVAAGIDALLVWTGGSSPAEMLSAGPAYRPRSIASGLSATRRRPPRSRPAAGLDGPARRRPVDRSRRRQPRRPRGGPGLGTQRRRNGLGADRPGGVRP